MSLEREAFEKWYLTKFADDFVCVDAQLDYRGSGYVDFHTQDMWEAWQASTQREGFKFVPVDDLDTLCMYGYNYGSEYDIDDLLDCVGRCKAMIEAV